MSGKYILSFDLGTSGVKAVLVSFNGQTCGMETCSYELIQPHAEWAEQRPQDYWNASCEASRKLMQSPAVSPDDIAGVVFATQWKGVIALDENGNVLHNSIIWMDRRDSVQAAQLSEKAGRKFATNDYWPRIMWLRDNCPDIFAKTCKITDANGYLKFRACGKLAIDMSEHFGYSFRKETDDYYAQVISAAGLDRSLFPSLVSPSDKVGELTVEAAAEMGLNVGTPVFGGLCDIPAVTIGSGASKPGAAHLYLGTSGWLGVSRSLSDFKGLVPVMFSEDRYCSVYGISAVCAAKDFAIRTYYGSLDYATVEQEISTVDPGSDGLLCVSGFFGEVAPPLSGAVKGTYMGISSIHERKHFVNATMEAICMYLRARKETLEKVNDLKLTVINAVGGGTLSPHWMQIFADVMNLTVRIPESPKYSGAVGAAYAAMIGLGKCKDYDELADKVGIIKQYDPIPENVQKYESLYSKWSKTVDLLKNVSDLL